MPSMSCLFLYRDVRRLVVAMSRARLGLYIFARVSLFQNCFELSAAFTQLTARPLKLYLAPQERYPTQRKVNDIEYCGNCFGELVEIYPLSISLSLYVHYIYCI